jgi:hypothetical protein
LSRREKDKPMLTKSLNKIVLICSTALLIVSCSNTKNVDIEKVIADKNTNNIITVTAPVEWNSFQTDSQVNLLVQLLTKNTVLIHEKDVVIFEVQNNNLIPIKNDIQYSPSDIAIQPVGLFAF